MGRREKLGEVRSLSHVPPRGQAAIHLGGFQGPRSQPVPTGPTLYMVPECPRPALRTVLPKEGWMTDPGAYVLPGTEVFSPVDGDGASSQPVSYDLSHAFQEGGSLTVLVS